MSPRLTDYFSTITNKDLDVDLFDVCHTLVVRSDMRSCAGIGQPTFRTIGRHALLNWRRSSIAVVVMFCGTHADKIDA